jgi:hypothetical protein
VNAPRRLNACNKLNKAIQRKRMKIMKKMF